MVKIYTSVATEDVLRQNSALDVIIGRLLRMIAPETGDESTEYVLAIIEDSICIFKVRIGQIPEPLSGSVLAQSAKGSIQIGFVDLFDRNVEESIYRLVKNYWQALAVEVQGELQVENRLSLVEVAV